MASELLINVLPGETRVALVENGRLVDLCVEHPAGRGITGNIYRGRVQRVLPGMQAAFVDVGLERAAFLYAGDVIEGEEGVEFLSEGAALPKRPAPSVEQVLHAGQEVLVQAAKEPAGTKGARVTFHLAFPGRYLVYLPLTARLGISRRIEEPPERERLREIALSLRNGGGGFIVRTAAEGAAREDLERDARALAALWERVRDRKERGPPGSLLHEEISASLRAVRDLLTADVARVLVDDPREYGRVRDFVSGFEPEWAARVSLYQDWVPLFDRHGVEVQIERMLGRKVWLPSGGYLAIDSSEALTAIDVNTGRYVGKKNFEETALRANLEAAAEAAVQIRLRNLAGIVVIDFIDMQSAASREKVRGCLLDALRPDKSRAAVTDFSALGMVELTRKRIREPVLAALLETCPYCEGRAAVRGAPGIAANVLRQLLREKAAGRGSRFHVRAHPDVVGALQAGTGAQLAWLQEVHGIWAAPAAEPAFHREHFEIRPA